MRNAFASEITVLAERDERIVLLSGDIGNRLFDQFKTRCPQRFYNCGVAEANMTGMAAGLALCGLRPVTYTITPFVTTRCLEQIRVDVCYHNLPVIIVGVGSGLSYAELGPTHHSCEDIAFLRALPNMTVICPADAIEARLALSCAVRHDGPVYIRLGKKGEPVIHQHPPDFVIGKGIVLKTGKHVCLLGTGTIMPVVLQAAVELEQQGISAGAVSMPTVKPLDGPLLDEIFSTYKLVITIEEHSRMGGFGSSIAEWYADRALPSARLGRMGTGDAFLHEAGDQDHARRHFGLTAQGITAYVQRRLTEARPTC